MQVTQIFIWHLRCLSVIFLRRVKEGLQEPSRSERGSRDSLLPPVIAAAGVWAWGGRVASAHQLVIFPDL